ncbi:MAG: helix-turn-helix transcriptional regulator [Arcobacteraceae bacterium]
MPIIQKNVENAKYDRIDKIYKMLLNSATGLTIKELSQELEVSTKTIQRDLYEVLSEFGAVKDGRIWKIDPKAASDNLDPNERIILGILDEMAKSAGKTFYSRAHTLLAQVSQQLEHPIFTGISSENLDDANIHLFETIEIAIKNKQKLCFRYGRGKFEVKPLKLVFFDGFWYLLAYDSKANDTFKKFHLKTIEQIQMLEQTFQTDAKLEEKLKKANSIWFELGDTFRVELLISKEVRKYFERKPLKGQAVVGQDNDGSLILELEIAHEMEIVPLIMYYIPHIKVLEPAWLAQRVKEKVAAYVAEL